MKIKNCILGKGYIYCDFIYIAFKYEGVYTAMFFCNGKMSFSHIYLGVISKLYELC